MMNNNRMDYRILARTEISKLTQIDRTETIDSIHYMRDGALVLEQEHWDVADWNPAEKQRRITDLQADYDKGATFFGAFAGPALAGLAVLDHNPVCTGIARFNLSGLWVSYPHRGKGVGKALCRRAAQEARERGAKTLYVSATPSENTVRFYMSLGFQQTALVDPDLFAKEPEDIHMDLTL